MKLTKNLLGLILLQLAIQLAIGRFFPYLPTWHWLYWVSIILVSIIIGMIITILLRDE